jgi:FAD/FMN-containing dehydrogenase
MSEWAGFEGEVFVRGGPGYDGARALWNGMIGTRPAVIARPTSTNDVAVALQVARERGLTVTVRGGGHGVAGNALSEGGLVIDLSALREIGVDPDARVARARGGVTLGELDRATQEFGLATPLGVVTKTGVAGLTLSGGIGWLRRKHGLAADNLVSLELVTADGAVVTASEAENPDLFWALRGGGGSFGVATAFEFRLHLIGPDVFFAFVLYPGKRAHDVLRRVAEYMRDAPDEVSPLAFLGRVPHAEPFPVESHGKPYVAVAAMYAGDPEEGAGVLEPLRSLDGAIVDLSNVLPYTEAQGILDEDYPDGWRYYWKSVDLEGLTDGVLDALAAAAEGAPSHHSTIDVWFHGGAMDRIPADGTAFGPRPAYLIGVEANWEDAADDEANVAWARATVDSLRGYSSGGAYLNFPGFFEEGEDLLRASYGEDNYARLQAIKEQVDPAALFGPLGGVRPKAVPA